MNLFLAALSLASANALVRGVDETAFYNFIREHNKVYKESELLYRFEIFKANLRFIEDHNAKNLSYTLGINAMADLTVEEFSARNSLVPRNDFGMNPVFETSNQVPPASVDWIAKGAVNPIKNQGQCGSCWAFSAVSAVESAHQIATGTLISLSEQQLVSCSRSYGNLGCNGGLMDSAFKYVEATGLCTEQDYPYEAKSDFLNCRDKSCTTAAKITGYTDVKPNDEAVSLLQAVAQQPVSIAIEADQAVFQFYKSGVFDNAQCGTQLDHGVIIVGYGTDSGVDYWNVRNSWGTSWGEAGYIRMVRNKDMCGLASQPSFPTGASLN